MISTKILIVTTIVLYLVGIIMVGVYFSRKNSGGSSSEFYLGGRKLGPLVTAMSAEASDMSGWLLMGLPGVAYWCGLADAAWTAIGLAVGTYINWLIVSKKIRRYSQELGAITLPDFFAKRYITFPLQFFKRIAFLFPFVYNRIVVIYTNGQKI